ncbi:MAG TPA: methylated-DNA--[protein]-cysteine S-methyltransferase [Chloroflexota bacterium]|nr:methylated-DNA--[protein]-cysteine S-methyltransferase [Chloroflexota bacterium]
MIDFDTTNLTGITAESILAIDAGTIVAGEAATPEGAFGAVFTSRGLARLTFPDESYTDVEAWPRKLAPEARVVDEHPALDALSAQLTAYFEGTLRDFSIPLDLRGTPFQLAVWQALTEIPYGETRSYGAIARAIGRPQASRAVGMANHQNPVPIVVPCHRVIGSNGTLTGYGGGLLLKARLLELEGVMLISA